MYENSMLSYSERSKVSIKGLKFFCPSMRQHNQIDSLFTTTKDIHIQYYRKNR